MPTKMSTKNWREESKGNTAEHSRPKPISPPGEEQFRSLVENTSDVITVLEKEGDQIATNAVNHDIIERKRVEAALKRSEERYALSQQAANIGSWDWDIRTGDLCWSDMIEPIFGFGRGEFDATYEAFLDCIHPEDRQHVIDSVNACVEAGEDYDIEHRIVWPDGTARWISETGAVFREEHGEAIRMLGIVQDITERKWAEEERERLLTRVQQDRQQIEELARVLERERYTLQAIMENTQAHLAYLDPQFNFVRVNSAYARGSGYSEKELIGRNHFALFPHAENQAIFEEVSGTGRPVTFHAKPFVYPDRPELGITYWDWTLMPVKDGDGRVEGLVLSLLDVTQRERSREALRRYADRLQVLHEIDQAIVATHSEEEIAQAALRHVRQLVPCLRASVMVFDFEASEMSLLAAHADGESRLGKGWRGSLEWAWFVEGLEQGQIHVVEDILALSPSSPLMEALQAEGVRAYVNVPIVSHGKPIGSLNLGMASPGDVASEQAEIAREVADELAIGIHHARLHQQVQRHADELEKEVARRTAALRASEARIRAIFEGAGLGMALVDMEGRLVESNPALQEILRRRAEEIRGMSLMEITHPDDAAADTKLYGELMAGKRDDDKYKVKRRYVRKDGQLRWCNLTVSLVQKARGRSQYAIVMVEDITEQKQIQQALIQSEKLAVTGRLAASLAHEINNPLQSVIGCLGLAEESLAEGEDAGEFLQIATEELERAAGIVTQLRDLNRPSKPEERKPTDVNALLEQVLMLTKKQCQKYQVEVNWEVADDLPPLMLVPDRMQQVLLNLVLNAVEAMPEGGRLQVGTSHTSDPSGVYISFADSGRGIAPNTISRVFDPFYTTKPEGLGLGLYITRNIVEEHGGHVEAESQVGEGATFKVWLPA